MRIVLVLFGDLKQFYEVLVSSKRKFETEIQFYPFVYSKSYRCLSIFVNEIFWFIAFTCLWSHENASRKKKAIHTSLPILIKMWICRNCTQYNPCIASLSLDICIYIYLCNNWHQKKLKHFNSMCGLWVVNFYGYITSKPTLEKIIVRERKVNQDPTRSFNLLPSKS